MKCITNDVKKSINQNIWKDAENTYGIIIRDDIKNFLELNGGGFPTKDIISVDGEEYEVRVFLSLDDQDSEYNLEKPLNYFLAKTNSKIVPIGIDSGDNYYCVNNETGKVYYWSAGNDQYYCIVNNLDLFVELFE